MIVAAVAAGSHVVGERGSRSVDDLPSLLTVPEAIALSRVGRTLAWRLLKEGAWPSVRVGRRLLIPTAQFLEVLGVSSSAPTRSTEGP